MKFTINQEETAFSLVLAGDICPGGRTEKTWPQQDREPRFSLRWPILSEAPISG